MVKYTIKRILLLIPILVAVIFIVYFLMDLTPGDPARIILGETATNEDIEALNEEMGFDDPFIVRFGRYAYELIVHQDFGDSWRTGRDVMGEVIHRFPTSFKLAVFGILLAALLGIPLGVVSAVKQYSALDNISRVSAMLLAAFPPFWLGMILVLTFSLKLGWLPASGVTSMKSYILPVVTIAVPQAASLMRFTRSTMLETIRQDYIRTARAKGLSEWKVTVFHALKNALLPIITVLGTAFGWMISGVVVIENVFGIAGMGQFALNAIQQKDVPQVMAAVIFLSVIFCLIMLVVDIMYAFVDPRIRSSYSSVKRKTKKLGRKQYA
ncbi:ABC transporter permease [Blautia marasmi]|uniref:ABC transporter permease n=1 Tax=Blautia marasmi TaxID=1917868 RepID=UPI000CF27F13|nr:ABC transporter permease [Blautia marasmi]